MSESLASCQNEHIDLDAQISQCAALMKRLQEEQKRSGYSDRVVS